MTTCTRCSAPLPPSRTAPRKFCDECRQAKHREQQRDLHRRNRENRDLSPRFAACATCGVSFRLTTGNRVYCTTKCSNIAMARFKRTKRLAAKQGGERPCGDCATVMTLPHGSRRRFCEACSANRALRSQRAGSVKGVTARTTQHDHSMGPGEVARYLDLACEAELLPAWQRAELRQQMDAMRMRRAQ